LELTGSRDFSENDLFEGYNNEELIVEDLKQSLDNTIEIIEEHLIDEQDELIEHEFELGDEIQLDQIEYIEEIPFTDEQLKAEDEMIEDNVIVSVTPVQLDQKNELEYTLEQDETNVVQGVDEYEDVSVDDIIKNPERNRFCFKIFECFFCKMVRRQ
jgi:hypothetical protein